MSFFCLFSGIIWVMKVLKKRHHSLPFKELIHNIWEMVKWIFAISLENDFDVYAGNATLYIVIAAFPFLVLLISFVNFLPTESYTQLINMIIGVLPEVSEIQDLVLYVLETVRTQSYELIISAAAIISLWFASSGITAIQKGLKRVTINSDNTIYDKPIALLCTVIFLLLIPFLLVFQLFGTSIQNVILFLAERHNYIDFALKLIDLMNVSGIITMVMASVIITLTFTYLPGGRRKIREQIPGAVMTTVVWLVFSRLFSIFIPMIYSTNSIYGSLTALFLTLLWLRILMFILLIGASLNTVLKLKAEHALPW